MLAPILRSKQLDSTYHKVRKYNQHGELIDLLLAVQEVEKAGDPRTATRLTIDAASLYCFLACTSFDIFSSLQVPDEQLAASSNELVVLLRQVVLISQYLARTSDQRSSDPSCTPETGLRNKRNSGAHQTRARSNLQKYLESGEIVYLGLAARAFQRSGDIETARCLRMKEAVKYTMNAYFAFKRAESLQQLDEELAHRLRDVSGKIQGIIESELFTCVYTMVPQQCRFCNRSGHVQCGEMIASRKGCICVTCATAARCARNELGKSCEFCKLRASHVFLGSTACICSECLEVLVSLWQG